MGNNILESMFDDFIQDNMIGLSESATKELLTDVQFFYKYCSEVSYVNIDLTEISSAQEEVWAKFHYWNEKYNYYMNGKGHYTDRSMLAHDIALYYYQVSNPDKLKDPQFLDSVWQSFIWNNTYDYWLRSSLINNYGMVFDFELTFEGNDIYSPLLVVNRVYRGGELNETN